MQNCVKCGENKPLDAYYRHPETANGYFSVCKPCYLDREAVKRRLRAGFSPLRPDYCECCGSTDQKLQLDHDHNTNMFRGFICRPCNQKIGQSGDTYESLLAADSDEMYLDYLKLANLRMGKST